VAGDEILDTSASRAAAMISSSVAFGLPRAMLSRILPKNRSVSCRTKPTPVRKSAGSYWRASTRHSTALKAAAFSTTP